MAIDSGGLPGTRPIRSFFYEQLSVKGKERGFVVSGGSFNEECYKRAVGELLCPAFRYDCMEGMENINATRAFVLLGRGAKDSLLEHTPNACLTLPGYGEVFLQYSPPKELGEVRVVDVKPVVAVERRSELEEMTEAARALCEGKEKVVPHEWLLDDNHLYVALIKRQLSALRVDDVYDEWRKWRSAAIDRVEMGTTIGDIARMEKEGRKLERALRGV